MLDPQTLRGRLTLTYASALVVALVAFAAVALLVIDRAQRSALDAQLSTTASAILAIAGESKGQVFVDVTDRSQFVSILGTRADGAIAQTDGRTVISSTVVVPRTVRAAAMRAARPGVLDLRLRGERIRAFVAPIRVRGRRIGSLAVWRNAEFIDTLDRSVALAFALAIPVLAAAAVLIGGAIARRGLEPLDRIATVASEIEGHDLSRRLALPVRGDELGRFAATFDRMLDRVQAAFARERRFTADASHELRAPLSVIRAEADLALRKERAPEEYRNALRSIAQEADALERLTRDLLAAARADAPLARRGVPVDLRRVVSTVAQRLGVPAAERGIRLITPRRDAAPVTVAADPDALERAVVTIVHNAIKYARESVALDVRHAAGMAELVVVDDGPGFSDEALERAFERFWRDGGAHAGEGSGLGLSIARAVVEGAGGSVSIANGENGGARVSLRFAESSGGDPVAGR